MIGKNQQYKCWEDGSLGMTATKHFSSDALQKQVRLQSRFGMFRVHLEEMGRMIIPLKGMKFVKILKLVF